MRSLLLPFFGSYTLYSSFWRQYHVMVIHLGVHYFLKDATSTLEISSLGWYISHVFKTPFHYSIMPSVFGSCGTSYIIRVMVMCPLLHLICYKCGSSCPNGLMLCGILYQCMRCSVSPWLVMLVKKTNNIYLHMCQFQPIWNSVFSKWITTKWWFGLPKGYSYIWSSPLISFSGILSSKQRQ